MKINVQALIKRKKRATQAKLIHATLYKREKKESSDLASDKKNCTYFPHFFVPHMKKERKICELNHLVQEDDEQRDKENTIEKVMHGCMMNVVCSHYDWLIKKRESDSMFAID